MKLFNMMKYLCLFCYVFWSQNKTDITNFAFYFMLAHFFQITLTLCTHRQIFVSEGDCFISGRRYSQTWSRVQCLLISRFPWKTSRAMRHSHYLGTERRRGWGHTGKQPLGYAQKTVTTRDWSRPC